MEKVLNKYITLYSFMILLSGCKSIGSFNCETFTPAKESLFFVNDTTCFYSWCDVLTNKKIVDTCYWKYESRNKIIIYKKNALLEMMQPISVDTTEREILDFIYDVCPKWYNISSEEFEKDPRYRYPIYQEHYSVPFYMPTFYEKFGIKHTISCDTALIISDSCIVLIKKKSVPSFFFADKRLMGKGKRVLSRVARKVEKQIYSWIVNSYEYLNYCVNYGKKVVFSKDKIIGITFSYINESGNKESIEFIDDSFCVYTTLDSMSTPYIVVEEDTCHYNVEGNLVAINFITDKDALYDTLAYKDGILFYSKVYKRPAHKHNFSMIVKPFISEKIGWVNRADSIQQILKSYYETYVPINMYK